MADPREPKSLRTKGRNGGSEEIGTGEETACEPSGRSQPSSKTHTTCRKSKPAMDRSSQLAAIRSSRKWWFALRAVCSSAAVLLFLSFAITAEAVSHEADVDSEQEALWCDPCEYYASIDFAAPRDQLRDALRRLLASTQRSLPYTDPDGDDVWKALQDVDRGPDLPDGRPTVRLVYSNNRTVASEPKGTRDTWNREHVWPRSRGIFDSGADNSDVHHLFPADPVVNERDRGNRYFGECPGTTTQEGRATCGDVFRPPETARGLVARAILYMGLRYADSLEVTDDPGDDPAGKHRMGHRSTLLAWNEEHPPDASEVQRNHRICSRWQHNRNPFVDVPGLARVLYGGNATIPDLRSPPLECGKSANETGLHNTTTEEASDSSWSNNNNTLGNAEHLGNNSSADTKPSEDAETLNGLPSPGDVMVVGVCSDNPDAVALVALEDLPAGLVVHLTDNEYNGTAFAPQHEGTMNLTLPGTVRAGTVFGFGQGLLYGSSWRKEADRNFDLSTRGDAVVVYATTRAAPHDHAFLSAVSFAGRSLGDASLPNAIGNFSVALGNEDNFVYTGATSAPKASLQQDLVDTNNWRGSYSKDTVPMTQWFVPNQDGFTITS